MYLFDENLQSQTWWRPKKSDKNFNMAYHGFIKKSNVITFKTKFMFIFNMLGTWEIQPFISFPPLKAYT